MTHGWQHPALRLSVGTTGKRITWISGGIEESVDPPVLLSGALNLGPGISYHATPGPILEAEIEISDAEKFPALWALPQYLTLMESWRYWPWEIRLGSFLCSIMWVDGCMNYRSWQ